jgi:hypothetical protein
MKRILDLTRFNSIALGLFLLAASPLAEAKADTTTTNLQLPLEATLVNPCTGELIAFSGTIHFLIHATATPSGNFHTTVHQNLQNVSGTGEQSGDTFHLQLGSTQVLTVAAGVETTTIQNIRVIGPGPDNNFNLHQTMHLTVNANGMATATVEHLSTSCQ